MTKRPPFSRRTWAFTGTGIILVLLFLAGSTMFHRSPQSQVRVPRGVSMDLAESPMQEVRMDPQCAPQAMIARTPAELLPPKLIRNAKISLEVKDFPRFESACRGLAQRYGYLSDLRLSREEDGRRRADLTIRVAAERLDAALAEFKALGTVKKEELTVEDVTRAYADLEARRANKRTTAARLREIIANRTGKLSDVIEAEQALGQVTEELESMEAQKRTMDGQIQYSTLHADVFEPPLPVKAKEPALWEPLMAAIKDGRSGLIATLAFTLEALIVGFPWILLLVLGILGYRRWHSLRPPREEVPEMP